MDQSVTHTGEEIRSLSMAALFKRNILIRCPACDHQVIVSALLLWWRWKRALWRDELRGVQDHLFCMACFRRTAIRLPPVITLSDDPVTGDLGLALPPEREWKRMVSRFRA